MVIKSRLLLSIGSAILLSTAVTLNETKVHVRFMDNKDSVYTTYSGMEATANSLLFEEITINRGDLVTEPTTKPTLVNFDFTGWYKDRECTDIFEFDTKVYWNLTLYAGYTRNQGHEQEEEFEEVQLSFVEKVDDSITEPIIISGVMNSPINADTVKLSNNALVKLGANAEDCTRYLNYVRKSNVTDLKATYGMSAITVNYKVDGVSNSKIIYINREAYTIDNSTYEGKATKYDGYVIPDYSIILGGSSSMENWSTSREDLDIFTTTNIGIGGTVVSHWDTCLNPRLVYPNNPRAVVYYLGINNIINSKQSGESTGNQLVAMFDHVHEHLPDTTIYFVMINFVPGYMSYKNEIITANNIVTNYAANKDYMVLIHAGDLLMKSNGNPSWAYFKTDGLHMSLAGYVLWGGEVRRVLKENEERLYGNK